MSSAGISLPPIAPQHVNNQRAAGAAAASNEVGSREDKDTVSVALAELRERLPPLRPPSPLVRKVRPAPPALHYGPRARSSLPKPDYDQLKKTLEKQQSQLRAVIESEEQKIWTHTLVTHLHCLAELEESIPYRESAARDALLREEEREAMILMVDHEARCQRIRSRDLIGIQLQMHMLALDQDEQRRNIHKTESSELAIISHKELVHRPVESDSPTASNRTRTTHKTAMHSGANSATNRYSSSNTQQQSSSGVAAVKKPIPPTRPINSAKGEDRFVVNGRYMWGQQKVLRDQQAKFDTAVESLPRIEAFHREELDGEELAERLAFERMYFEEVHQVGKKEQINQHHREEEELQSETAHRDLAIEAVALVMSQVMAVSAGRVQPNYVEEKVHTAAEVAVGVAHSSSDNDDEKNKKVASAATSASPPTAVIFAEVCESKEQKKTSPFATSQDNNTQQFSSSSESEKPPIPTTFRGRTGSLTKIVDVPFTVQYSQKLLSSCLTAVSNADRLLSSLDLITLVDTVHQSMFPVEEADQWKMSGIAAIREANTALVSNDNSSQVAITNPALSVTVNSLHEEETEAASVVLAAAAASEQAENQQQQQQQQEEEQKQYGSLRDDEDDPSQAYDITTPLASPRGSSRILFPSLDLLCSALLDIEALDGHEPWRVFLSAVLDVESDAGVSTTKRSQNILRFYQGHKAPLSRDYLEHVLWRTDDFHTGIVNALELIPTRWTGYKSEMELEQEEKQEVVLGEMLARERLIQEQIDEYCSLLNFVEVQRERSVSHSK